MTVSATAISVVLAGGCAELAEEPEMSTTGSELSAPEPCSGCWLPSVGARWQYQLQGNTAFPATGGINVDIDAVPASGGPRVRPEVFDIDLYESELLSHKRTDIPNAKAVAAIHDRGAKAICYVSAGSFEQWRPDARVFPPAVLGRKNGWPGEQWVDIRSAAVKQIMEARAIKCKQAGFDAIEWDNVDGYANRTGFPLTAADQLEFNTFLANLAHTHGLSVGLKNDTGQLAALKPYFDFAINEECFRYRECDFPAPGYPDWTSSGKAVFNVEYRRSNNCARANAWQLSSILKSVDLFDVPYTPCR